MPHLGEVIAHLFHPRRSNNQRPRILHAEALMMLAFVSIGFTFLVYRTAFFNTSMGTILGYATNITAAHVIEQTNQQRASQGLSPLNSNGLLASAAEKKAADMFSHQYWAHVSPAGVQPWTFISDSGYSYRWAGENLARDFGQTSEMMVAWMNSPSHRANIVHDRYTEIGIAVVNGVLEGRETTLVVQMFGTPATQVASISPESDQVSIIREYEPEVKEAVKTNTLVVTEAPTKAELVAETSSQPSPEVKAGASVPSGSLLSSPQLSPLELMQAFFLSIVFVLIVVLLYDFLVASDKNLVRLVGKNIAHLALLTVVAFLIIFFRSGLIK